MNRKFVLIAFGTLMAAPVMAQTEVTTRGVRRSPSPLDTMRAMLQRRNPTIDEVLALSADVVRRQDEWRMTTERALSADDEVRRRELMASRAHALSELMASQRLLAEACGLIRPHQGESEGVLGFQIVPGTAFHESAPLVKEERFVRAPEILFVEPNTPAAKADVREGDVWLSIAGKDLVNRYVRELNEVLKPGNRVELKLRRDGREVNVEVTAKKRPEYPEEACNPKMLAIGSSSPVPARMQVFTGQLPNGRSDFFTMKVTKSIVAGAVFADLTNDQREAFIRVRPDEGVFVESVAEGSVAHTAGLRAFDVVTRANNQIVASTADLIKIVQGGGQVSLWVVRGETQRGVILPAR
jgi:membrane-associated protease RseP (regulator of RpoE activity)